MQRRQTLKIEGFPVCVTRKKIRHLYIRLKPPAGEVCVSAPLRMDDDSIRRAVIARKAWIAAKQSEICARPVPERPSFAQGEIHYVEGRPYPLLVSENSGREQVSLTVNGISLETRSEATRARREQLLDRWYRQELEKPLPQLLSKWEPVLGVNTAEWRIRKMKTRWGSCNIKARRICLNLALAKQPPECLEYVLVHELLHLLERRHNERFYQLMDNYLPDWRRRRERLNGPLR